MLLVGIKMVMGAMYARRGCVCQLQRRFGADSAPPESDILADRRIRIVHTWPPLSLNTNIKTWH